MGSRRPGDKGILTTRLARGTQRLALLNTRLQSQYSSRRHADIRSRQVEELQVEVERLPLAVPVIAAGDLKTPPSEPLYIDLECRWIDLGRAGSLACGSGTHFLPDGNEGGWIDYILARRIPERRTQVTAFELIRNTQSDESYSAHHGLLATVELSRPVEVAQLVALALLLMTATIARTSLSRRAWLKTMMLGLIRS